MPQTWEYRLIQDADGATLLDQLAKAGDEGWEAIGLTRRLPAGDHAHGPSDVTVLLKRPKERQALPVPAQKARAHGWQPSNWK